MSQLTQDERWDIVSKSINAASRGDYDEAVKLSKQKPLTPWVAKGVKEIFGSEYLKGWDLSEAEAEYGTDWLNR